MSLLGWLILGALLGVVVYETYVSYIDKKSAIEAAKKVMKDDEFKKTLKAKVLEKSSSSIKLDMLDSSSSTVCQVKISGDNVSNDIKCADIIYV